MKQAARAIIFNGDRILVMFRNKYGSTYYTLVGGRVDEGETPEQAVVREVKEETGMDVTTSRQVFIEDHPEPYNKQTIFLCQVSNPNNIAVQENSEEGLMNKLDANIHTPMWVDLKAFETLAFRTPYLQKAILNSIKIGFPNSPIKI